MSFCIQSETSTKLSPDFHIVLSDLQTCIFVKQFFQTNLWHTYILNNIGEITAPEFLCYPLGIFLIWTLIKWSEQYILDSCNNFYISRAIKKSLKQLHIIVYLNLSLFVYVPNIVLFLKFLLGTLVNKICWYCKCGTDRKYTETNNNVLTDITFARRKSIITACKMYVRLFFNLRGLPVI
jgi:hypothetical protein